MDWSAVIIQAITTIPATIFAYAAYVQSTRAHTETVKTGKEVNSRMTEMLALNTDAATLAEKTAEHVRKGEAAVATAESSNPKEQ